MDHALLDSMAYMFTDADAEHPSLYAVSVSHVLSNFNTAARVASSEDGEEVSGSKKPKEKLAGRVQRVQLSGPRLLKAMSQRREVGRERQAAPKRPAVDNS